ncbi:unnamed protein product, partial [Effrenium voratum]
GFWKQFVLDLCQVEPNSRLPMRRGGVSKLEKHAWFQQDCPGCSHHFSWSSLDMRELAAPFVPRVRRSSAEKGWVLSEDPPSSKNDWAADFEDLDGPSPENFNF